MMTELESVLACEQRLHDPAVRADAEALDRLLHPDFMEIGASGNTWTRADLIDRLVESPHLDDLVVRNMSARHVTADVIVVHYTTSTPARVASRTSWWTRADQGWRCVFHQGTVVPGT
jgi:hypothetical protein